MDTMLGFRNNTVRARGYTFSDEEIRSFRIVGVFNSMTDVDYMNERYVDEFIAGCYDPRKGEICISESAVRSSENGGLVRVLSVIVFANMESMELYILANPRLYLPVDRSMGGRLN